MLWLCFCVFPLVLPSAFLRGLQKKVNSFFVKLWHLLWKLALRLTMFNPKHNFPHFSRFLTFFPLTLLFSELSAGLGGGSRGRSHLQRDTKEGSDSAGGQQGSKMARGESDVSHCDRITADKAFSKYRVMIHANPQRNRSHTGKPYALSRLSLSIVGRLSALCSTRAVVLTFEL